jgi:hypothetical protein
MRQFRVYYIPAFSAGQASEDRGMRSREPLGRVAARILRQMKGS